MSKYDVFQYWSYEWVRHHHEVIQYFSNIAGNRLLVFHIDTDGPMKLVRFFKDWFHLKADHYIHKGKTNQTNNDKAILTIQDIQYNSRKENKDSSHTLYRPSHGKSIESGSSTASTLSGKTRKEDTNSIFDGLPPFLTTSPFIRKHV